MKSQIDTYSEAGNLSGYYDNEIIFSLFEKELPRFLPKSKICPDK